MADSYGALIKTTTATTGTLDYVLATTALTTAHRTPKQAVADGSLSDGDIVQYMARDTKVTGDASFELGEGIYTDATNEIARDAANIHDGSNGPGVLTIWPGSGQRDIYLVVSPSVQGARLDRINNFTLPVGIGIDTPDRPLHIKDPSVAGIKLEETDGTNPFLVYNREGDQFSIFDETNILDRLVIDSLGHVGIGEVDPATNLHIKESTVDTVPTVEIEQLSTGDAALQFSIVGDAMAQGFDNSDSDQYVFSYAASAGGAVLGTNNRIEIDSAGDVNIVNDLTVGGVPVDRFAAGTAMVFHQAAAPTGWTQSAANNDKALRVVSGAGGGTGGSVGLSSSNVGSTAISVADLAAHDHDFQVAFGTDLFASGTDLGAIIAVGDTLGGGGVSTVDTRDTGSNSTHTHSLALAFIDVIVATKD